MTKNTLIAGVILALAIIVGVGLYISYETSLSNNPVSSAAENFSSQDIGLSFTYPKNYELAVTDDQEGAVRIITLMDKANLPVGQNTEGPPAITVQRFDNPQNLSLDEWIRTTPASNWQLSTMGELGASTVGGEPGLGYTYSGLYEETSIAVAHNGKIYLFSVGILTAEDQIKTDFFTLLDSVKFI